MIEAMLQSALRSAELAEQTGLGHDRIIISAKVSGVRDLVDVYRLLADRCDYPLHLGLTEAGMGDKGIIASTAGLAILLNEGIGDTIRVSLTPEPGAPREREVEVAQQVLQSMGLRSFLPQVSACPGCGRTTSTFFQEMAQQIQAYLKDRMPEWRETHPGAEELRVAVMGCVVNGPGESKHADIGISLPGTFEEPVAPVFIDGKLDRTLRGDGLVAEFIDILEDYVARRYPGPEVAVVADRTPRGSSPLRGRPGEVAAMAEHLEVGQVISARDAAVGALEGLDVVDLKTQGGSRIRPPRLPIASDLRGLEATSLAGPAGPTAGRGSGPEPHVVPFELAGMSSAAERRPPGRQRPAAARQTADGLRQVDARDVFMPEGACHQGS